MAVDRGELRYGIRVEDQFSRPLNKFRADLEAAKKAIDGFRAASGFSTVKQAIDGVTASTRRLRTEEQIREDIAKKAEREQVARARAIDASARQRARTERELGAIVRQKAKDEAAAARAAEQSARVAQRAAEAQRRAAQAQAQASQTAVVGQRRIQAELNRTESAANRVAFTFRRLFGILAAFTIAREGVQLFGSLVTGGVQFNAEIAQSRLGIAGIVTATGQLRNAQGEVVQGAEAFSVALGVAEDQQQKLLAASLETVATYEELLQAFQIATGPGLAAGLNIDQVRTLTIQISQAAAAIGLQQNQLSEEIRALFTGNIRATTTRIAQVLNLTNRDIRRALEEGGAEQLFTLLNTRLQGFSLAAKEAANDINGLFARIRDGFRLVAGRSAEEFTSILRGSLRDVLDIITVLRRDADTGLLIREPRPEVLQAFRAIFNALQNILLTVRQLAASAGFDSLVNNAQTFADILQVAGQAAAVLVFGIIRGFSTVRAIVQPVIELVRNLVASFGELTGISFPVGSVTEFATAFVQVITAVATLRFGLTALLGLGARLGTLYIRTMTSIAIAINTATVRTKELFAALQAVGARLTFIQRAGVLAGGAFVALSAGILLAARSIVEDFDLALGDLPELVGIIVEQAFTKALGIADLVATFISVKIRQGLSRAKGVIEGFISDIKAALDFELGASEDLQRLAAREREADAQERARKQAALDAKLQKEIEESLARQKQTGEDADKLAGERLQKLRQQIQLRNQESKVIQDQLAAAAQTGPSVLAAPGTLEQRPQEVTDEEREKLAVLQQQIAATQAELQVRRLINQTMADGVQTNQELADIEVARLVELNAQLEVIKEQGRQKIEDAEKELELAVGDDRRTFLQERLNTLKDEQSAKEGDILEKLRAQELVAKRQQQIATGTLSEGLGQGLKDFAARFSSVFQAGLNLATSAVNSFTQFVSTSIVDAFDPTQDFDLKERFARFLQDLAKQILTTLTQLIIATAIARAFGVPLPAGNLQVPSLPTFAEGGAVPGGPSYESAPPRGAPRTDTVLARLTPGEHVMTRRRVQEYGLDFFEAIRKGLVDPEILRSAAGLGRRRHVSNTIPRGPYYQSGGLVSGTLDKLADQSQTAAASGGAAAQAGPTPAYIVGDDQAVDRFLNSGKGGVLAFMRQNAAKIDGILRASRTG